MDRQALYFTVANLRQYKNEEQQVAVDDEIHMNIAASDPTWRFPSSPIVDTHAASLS